MVIMNQNSPDLSNECELKGFLNNSVKQAFRKYMFGLSAFTSKCGASEFHDSETYDDHFMKYSKFGSLFRYDWKSIGGLRIILLNLNDETEERRLS